MERRRPPWCRRTPPAGCSPVSAVPASRTSLATPIPSTPIPSGPRSSWPPPETTTPSPPTDVLVTVYSGYGHVEALHQVPLLRAGCHLPGPAERPGRDVPAPLPAVRAEVGRPPGSEVPGGGRPDRRPDLEPGRAAPHRQRPWRRGAGALRDPRWRPVHPLRRPGGRDR